MLVVPQREFQQFEEQKEQYGTQQEKNKRYKLSHVRVILVMLVLTAFFAGLGLTSLTAELNAKGYELYELQQAVEKMESNNQRLKLEIARLETPQRIQLEAEKRLGMIQPTSEDIQMVSLDFNNYFASEQESNIIEPATYAEVDVRLKPKQEPWFNGIAEAVASLLISADTQSDN